MPARVMAKLGVAGNEATSLAETSIDLRYSASASACARPLQQDGQAVAAPPVVETELGAIREFR